MTNIEVYKYMFIKRVKVELPYKRATMLLLKALEAN